jgi:hypothetical protein
MTTVIPSATHATPLAPKSKIPAAWWIGGALGAMLLACLFCLGVGIGIGLAIGGRHATQPAAPLAKGNTDAPASANADPIEKVARANFEKMAKLEAERKKGGQANHLELDEMEAVLGLAKEVWRGGADGNIANVTWQSKDKRCVIRATIYEHGPSRGIARMSISEE